MKYVPDAEGRFAGQLGYGYRSIEAFVDGVRAINSGAASLEKTAAALPSSGNTLQTTAILEAGRRSLDNGGRPVRIKYAEVDADAADAAGAGAAAGSSPDEVPRAAFEPIGLEVM